MSRNFEILQRAAHDRETKGMGNSIIDSGEPRTFAAESLSVPRQELSKLVHRLFLFGEQSGPRVVVFTGVGGGIGCSSICAGAGEVLAAQADGPVCIIDANLRSPHLHQYFHVDNHLGLTDAAIKPGPIRAFAHRIRGGDVWLLPAGSMTSPLSVLLRGNRLAPRIEELRKEFRFVLIDTPSVNDHTDAILLGQLTDGVVLVLESRLTRREVARKAKENIESANVPVIGAVLNRREFPIPPFIYERL